MTLAGRSIVSALAAEAAGGNLSLSRPGGGKNLKSDSSEVYVAIALPEY